MENGFNAEIRESGVSMVKFRLIPDKFDAVSQVITLFFILAMLSKVWWLDAICYFKIVTLTLMKIKLKVAEVTQKIKYNREDEV